jgi:hypothetical protein
VEAEQQEREEGLFMDSNIIKVVKQYKYLGTEEESKRAVVAVDAEVKKRIGMMYTAYNKFDKVNFSNKRLRLEKKLEMFVCMVIPAGLYNCFVGI